MSSSHNDTDSEQLRGPSFVLQTPLQLLQRFVEARLSLQVCRVSVAASTRQGTTHRRGQGGRTDALPQHRWMSTLP
jgi:hypothetical protein